MSGLLECPERSPAMTRYKRAHCSTCDREVAAYVPSHARNGALVYRFHNNRFGGPCVASGMRVLPEDAATHRRPIS